MAKPHEVPQCYLLGLKRGMQEGIVAAGQKMQELLDTPAYALRKAEMVLLQAIMDCVDAEVGPATARFYPHLKRLVENYRIQRAKAMFVPRKNEKAATSALGKEN